MCLKIQAHNSSNSIPLVLSDHFGTKTIGEISIFICGFGAGLSYACGDLKIDTSIINPLIETDAHYKEAF